MEINYERYRFSSKELIFNTIIFLILASIIAYLFYDSLVVFVIFWVLCPVFISWRRKRKLVQRREELKKQFCDYIACISTALSAGFSVENSFRESLKEVIKTYGDKSDIVIEMLEIIKKLDIGVPLSSSLSSFAVRAKIEDISDFITVFIEATKSGGNLSEIIRNTVNIMQEKRRVEEEIEAMLKGKMLEQKVISIIPFFIFLYMRVSSGDFTNILYHNPAGICVMTICLIIYILSFFLSEKIIKITL